VQNTAVDSNVQTVQTLINLFLQHLDKSSSGRETLALLKDKTVQNLGLPLKVQNNVFKRMESARSVLAVTSPLTRILSLNTTSQTAKLFGRLSIYAIPTLQGVASLNKVQTAVKDIQSESASLQTKVLGAMVALLNVSATGLYAHAASTWASKDFGMSGIADVIGDWHLPAAIALTSLSDILQTYKYSHVVNNATIDVATAAP